MPSPKHLPDIFQGTHKVTLRFSNEGPAFPSQLVDALLSGDVVFLCGAGVSAPQLSGFL